MEIGNNLQGPPHPPPPTHPVLLHDEDINLKVSLQEDKFITVEANSFMSTSFPLIFQS